MYYYLNLGRCDAGHVAWHGIAHLPSCQQASAGRMFYRHGCSPVARKAVFGLGALAAIVRDASS